MRILVIGGLGFIGTHLIEVLAAAGHTITILDKHQPLEVKQYQSTQANVCDLASIQPHFERQDLVINLAAEHHDNVRPVSLYEEVNVEGARNVCRAAAKAGVTRMLFTSSVAIYGSQNSMVSENSAPNYFNEYGRTKLLAEGVYRAWRSESLDRSLVIVRPTVVFGAGNKGNVYNLLRQIKYGPFVMVGNGRNIKSIAAVENVSAFISHLIGQWAPGETILNYSDGPDLSMRELILFSHGVLGKEPRLARVPYALGLAVGAVADLASVILRRPFPVSAIRIQKFCANSKVDSRKAFSTGFVPPLKIRDAISAMLTDHV